MTYIKYLSIAEDESIMEEEIVPDFVQSAFFPDDLHVPRDKEQGSHYTGPQIRVIQGIISQ